MVEPEVVLSLVTLTLMEIVLGIDNIIFLSILADRLPPEKQGTARTVGLVLALAGRLGLLFAIGWIMSLENPLFPLFAREISGKDLILLGGGLFLMGKATHEIYHKLEGHDPDASKAAATASMGSVLVQILLMDIVFSLDSVITAVGMAKRIWVMATAMVVAVGVMLAFSAAISRFVNRHPSMKILALSFLVLIGVMLVVEGWQDPPKDGDGDTHGIPKGYIYFAMAFSLAVELLNMRFRKKQAPVKLHEAMEPAE